MSICEVCGREFNRNVNNQKYCSKECRNKARNRHLNISLVKTCSWCGKWFVLQYRQQKTCSEKCKCYQRLEQNALYSHKYYHRHKHEMGDRRCGLGCSGLGQHARANPIQEHVLIRNELKRLGLTMF